MHGKYKGSILVKQVDFILRNARGLILFTDLDATLLDHYTYDYQPATAALHLLKQFHIPLILTSSKTFDEVMHWRKVLDLSDPFIFENGGGIAFPPDFPILLPELPTVQDLKILFLSPPYAEIVAIVRQLKTRFSFRGFFELTPEEIARRTGLPLEAARRAKNRLCSEPIIWEDSEAHLKQFKQILNSNNLQVIRGGRFYHVLGNSTNKGVAVQKVIHLFSEWEGFKRVSIGLGDSPNDLPMWQAVDIPVAVQRPNGQYTSPLPENTIKAPAKGPEGWNQAVLDLVHRWQALNTA